ncbi:MAG: hypothetical protein HQM11_14305 [SAR324 cluster bacterium]|nr:hypothetical protein [SAR324 cluster bacterium]
MPLVIIFLVIFSGTSVWAQNADYNTPVLVLQDNTPVYQESTGSKEEKKLPFMETLWTCRPCVTKEHKGRLQVYWYDGAEDDPGKQYKLMGWMEQEDLLLNRTALKDEETDIIKKVVLSNNPVQHQKDEKLDKIPIRFSPRENAKIEAELGIFDFYMVYAETKNFLLIGNSVGISKPLLAKDTILGWVPRARTTAWRTREAIQFDELNRDKRQPVKIYQTLDGLKDKNEKEVIGTEDFKYKTDFNSFRFPVISKSDKKNYYEVYYVGEIHTEDGDVVAAGDYDVASNALKNVQEKLKGLQILIVVDATKSMEFAFPPIARAISKFTRNQRVAQYDVKFSLGVYRDIADGKGIFELKRFTDAVTMERYIDQISKDTSFARSSPDDKSFLEAVYQGIERSISQQQIKDQLLGVIVIGDHGSHLEEVSVREKNRNSHEAVAEALKQYRSLFFPIQVATHSSVTDLSTLPKVPTLQTFYDQMRDLLKDNNQIDRKVVFIPKAEGEDPTSTAYQKKLEDAIKQYMREALDAIIQLSAVVTAKQQGASDIVAKKSVKNKPDTGTDDSTLYGVKLSEILEKWLKQEIEDALKQKGITDPAQLNEMVEQQWKLVSKNRSQLFRKGYLENYQNNIPQMEEMVLVEKKNIVNLVSNFEKILNAYRSEPKKRTEACRQTVLGILGEAMPDASEQELRKLMEDEGLTMESINRKMTGINFKGNNSLLTRHCDEWSSMDPIQMESDANRIRLSQDRLFKVLNNQESLWQGTEEPHPVYSKRQIFKVNEIFVETTDQLTGKPIQVDFRPKKYWWQRGGATYAWIPFMSFP